MNMSTTENANDPTLKSKGAGFWVVGLIGLTFLLYLLLKDRKFLRSGSEAEFVTKIAAFQTPETAIGHLEKTGIGKLSEFRGDSKSGYYAVSEYYPLEERKPGERMANNLSLYVGGRYSSHIETAKLILHLNNPSDSTEAFRKFSNKAEVMLKALRIEKPKNFDAVIAVPNTKRFASDVYLLEIALHEGNIKTWELIVHTK